MKKILFYLCFLFLICFSLYQVKITVFAEQSGSSPESGSSSYFKTAYDWLVAKGSNYGSTDAADWTNDWGTWWNRIMEAAAWEPDGTATASLVADGYTFYAGSGDRTIKTGTLFQNMGLQDYDDWRCSNNNQETNTACAVNDNEYIGEEATWTLTATGGTAASVTDNSVTKTLTSNKVYLDSRTKLYWTDGTTTTLDNEFAYVDGDDRTNPTGNSCNFNSTGTANAYCDNQDPTNAYTEDNDVSANDFCLNLELDADNADSDSDGLTGVETDWRLPSEKEILQAYIDGADNNLPTMQNYNYWSTTESYADKSKAWYIYMYLAQPTVWSKNTAMSVRCVRRN